MVYGGDDIDGVCPVDILGHTIAHSVVGPSIRSSLVFAGVLMGRYITVRTLHTQ